MSARVFVDGQDGTTGLRIHEVLAERRDVEVLRIDPERRKDPAERARLINAADVVFLCLPDAAAKESAALATHPSTCIIDASTAHRTAPGWTFGLAELTRDHRAKLREAKRIANPGCHSTGFILLLRPLVDAGLIPRELPVHSTSLTGYSGGGKKMIERYQAGGQPALQSPRPYALGLTHKHLPEMQAYTGLAVKPHFVPVVGPFYQGMGVMVPLQLCQLDRRASAASLHAALEERYAGERFVKVMPLRDPAVLAEGEFDVQACNGSNRAEIFVFGSDDQVLLLCRLDNLGKGASGAAVQAMNIHLGVDEGLGL
ncbi:MAG: N-acetyl-gamma-glutamyl-phosphate reductase [Rubrivivax sp.]|jgi:N-acetyl-gamma-glutamyl-phosphate reductase|nr:N-acetyl-gamma-glutamyl-phosphate reductase [Rubrivivax sp.]